MSTEQALLDFFGRLRHERVVDPALVAALDDPEPWTDVPDIALPERAVSLAYLAREFPFTVEQRMRLWRLGHLNGALKILLAEVRHDVIGFEVFRRASSHAGFAHEVQLGAVLRELGESLPWISDTRLDTITEAWSDLPAALVSAVRGKVGDLKLGAGGRGLAMEMLVRLESRPKGSEEAIRLLALSGKEEVRARAVGHLTVDDSLMAWVSKRLSGGTAGSRRQAAAWLGELAGAAAIEPLKAAAAKERIDDVLVSQLRVLESLGVPPEQVLDRDNLAARLEKAAKKGTQPDDYTRDRLPGLVWRDGSVVDDSIVDAWVRTCHKRKKADPTPMLQVIAGGVEPESGAAFALALLQYWFALDEPAEPDPWGREGGDGTPHKGLLALAAALGDERLLAPSEHYLKTWYGWRSSQCKGLLTMLAHIDSRPATQYIIRIATRFRTAGIKKHAQEELDAMAERRGWTSEELADRTLDDGGLGPDGVKHLDYLRGEELSRRFVLSMTPALTLQITHEGAVLKGLPRPRAEEDADSVKLAKKQLTASRKAFKTFLKGQTTRLHGALVSQREWAAPLWQEAVLGHPVLGELARRLVWVRDDGVSFRPAEDGVPIDLEDESVELGPDNTVRLAHRLVDTVGKAWGEHFADYEIVSILDQFGRPVWTPDEEALEATAIDAMDGTEVGALQLRGRAVKLGYDMKTGDGGYIDAFYKEFRSLGFTVRVCVDELRHPIEDMDVTLGLVTFEREGRAIPLAAVPPVLRSEVHADLMEFASMTRPT